MERRPIRVFTTPTGDASALSAFSASRATLTLFLTRPAPTLLPKRTDSAMTQPPAARRVRIVHYCTWADQLEDAAAYLERLAHFDVRTRVTDPNDARIVGMARLDCDWHAENARVFASLVHPQIEFLPARVVGRTGLAALLQMPFPADEEIWLVVMGQQFEGFGQVAAQLLALLKKRGLRVLFYAFDEASRSMPCFNAIAPHLDVLPPTYVDIHRSWVANLLPFSTPFCEAPEEKIVFLGSQLGLTPHRQRQIDVLKKRVGDRVTAIPDHSLPVNARGQLAARFKVSVCPEGRKFGTPAMHATHTDRPFWSGCLGLMPVSEDSQQGGRLEALHQAGLIVRYAHADLDALAVACERALAATSDERRRIYEHFNQHETVGTVTAEAIAATPRHP